MEIFHLDLDNNLKYKDPIVACVGYFDGIHLGHQALINKAIEESEKYHAKTCMISFDPDPWVVTMGLKDVKHINEQSIKFELLDKFKVDVLVILHFTKEMCALSSLEFTKLLKERLNLKGLVVGFDFHYGFKGKGDVDSLKNELGNCPLSVVEPIIYENEKISSTRIEKALKDGNILLVNKLLGYDFYLDGTVIAGHKLGRTIGFPTANIKYHQEQLLPKPGVYKGYIKVNDEYFKAMINIGHNPTFNYTDLLSLEIYILDFNKNIYGSNVRIIFKDFIRSEMKFDSKEGLMEQLTKDKIETGKQMEYQDEA